ncbi:hypothetical protein CDD80_6393 [Ophiocordyceps camponoti-rufipedis]|uniref:RRM domain-containing protein n=1 Tax=Ophiocordyceps camponoti-rufipedis TaxID=2004952 RepID=A0A2C5YQ97_9HYPO|nr:hypothetical protein CDD80_6393 [Ophiocordyceps camponoti-rufipedis]
MVMYQENEAGHRPASPWLQDNLSDFTSARLTPSPHCSPKLAPIDMGFNNDDKQAGGWAGWNLSSECGVGRNEWNSLNLIPVDARWAFDRIGSAPLLAPAEYWGQQPSSAFEQQHIEPVSAGLPSLQPRAVQPQLPHDTWYPQLPGTLAPRAPMASQGVFDTRQLLAALPPQGPRRDMARPEKRRSQGFLPMMAVSDPEHRLQIVQASYSTKFSTHYHGMHTDNNASADHLTPAQNCALWLTNLPANINYDELLDSVTNIGRIWCTYINLPDMIRHQTAAAKVVFSKPEAAQKLLNQSWTSPIMIREHRIRVSHNRIKYPSNELSDKRCRVLIITGCDTFVNPDTLRCWFTKRFVFQEDRVIVLIRRGGRSVVEFRFGSYRNQAQMGVKALELDRPDGFEKVEYGDDPCETGETFASYGVAAERIQGKGL